MSSVWLSFIFVMSILLRPTASSFARASRPRLLFDSITSIHASSFTTKYLNKNNSDDIVLDPLVVCGPSGVGKGTIITKYMEEHGGEQKFGFTVSHTTRAPRPGEEDGIHYHFSNHPDMRDEIEEGKFLEHAEVHGNLYGTSWDSLRDIQKSGKHCLLDIDVQGVQRLKSLESPTLQPRYIFIAPPSLQVLQQRLQERGTESQQALEERTRNANAEVEYGLEPGNFDYVVVNNDLEEACRDFANAVSDAYPDTNQ